MEKKLSLREHVGKNLFKNVQIFFVIIESESMVGDGLPQTPNSKYTFVIYPLNQFSFYLHDIKVA